MHRGEFYRLHHPPGDPKYYRVFVIVSRQSMIDTRFSTVICAPVFTEGQGMSTQVRVGVDEGLKHDSWIQCDGLTSLRKSELRHYIGSLSGQKIVELDQALAMALGIRFLQ